MSRRREAVKEFIDDLPDDAFEQVEAILREVQSERIRVAIANAPVGEPLTDDERASLARTDADIAAGRLIADEDLDAILEERLRATS